MRRRSREVRSRGPETLARILSLEAERGHDNRAVVGGTHRLLLAWLDPAATQARSWASRRRLETLCAGLEAYPELSREAREKVIEACRRELEAVGGSQTERVVLEGPVSQLAGIGPRRAYQLAGVGIVSVEDLLLYLPSRYLDLRDHVPVARLVEGQQAVVRVWVSRAPRYFPGRRASRVEAPAEDRTGRLLLRWFNQPYRAEQIGLGDRLVVLGRVSGEQGRMVLTVTRTIEHEREADRGEGVAWAGGVLAEYRAPEGVPAGALRQAVAQALAACEEELGPVAPVAATEACGLLARPESLRAVHLPASAEEAELGRRSLVFERLFVLQTRLLQHRVRAREGKGGSVVPAADLADRVEELAGFRLTNAQRRVVGELAGDLEDERPAYRLVHGDVGSGKTVVAAAALVAAADARRQSALMAPTEMLAEQHALRLAGMLAPAGVRVYLLTGSLGAAARRDVAEAASSGDPAVFVGTHALIQQGVEFTDLAVVVVDEQHRFGVAERAALVAKGYSPNFLALSATPLPRTLALALYADFDISVLDELPPGRRPVDTRLLHGEQRQGAYLSLRRRVEEGDQAFVVCPLIEPSEAAEAEAAREVFQMLRDSYLAGLRLVLVHGRMATPQRQKAMGRFYLGDADVLVSTTVIEVGLDVPKASVILVESAERFGLAQLHQLRGRVTRSRRRPLCMFLTNSPSRQSGERLRVLAEHSDGFRIAEADLRMRGAGDLAGLRQHGMGDWIIGDVLAEPDLLVAAQRQARVVVSGDPELARPEHSRLREAVGWLGELEKGRWAL